MLKTYLRNFKGEILLNIKLDPKLEKDSFLIDVFDEIQISTFNDSRYIWFILAPAIPQLKNWHDLQSVLESKLFFIIRNLSKILSETLNTDKINIAFPGNIESQFHLPIIARYKGDASCPNPVLGDGVASALEKDEIRTKQKLILDL